MNVQRWINNRRPDWQRFETLLQTIDQQQLRGLPVADLQALGAMYRQVSADLAKAQMQQMGADLVNYLQGLALRGYNQVYQPPVVSWGQQTVDYLRHLPRALRKAWPYLATSLGIFGVGMLVGGILYLQDSSFIETLLPPSAIAGVTQKHQLWTGSLTALAPLSSSRIIANNISVAFSALAGGMLLGLGTVYVLFTNGVLMGGIALFIADHGLSYPFWAFVSAHGVPELSAIFLSGAAGLMLGRALLLPWPYRRKERLVLEGRETSPLLVLVVVLLLWAGILEGFISPNDQVSPLLKYGLGAVELTVIALFLGVGRKKA